MCSCYTNPEEFSKALEELRITEDEYISRIYFGENPLAGFSRAKRIEDVPFNKPVCRVSTNGGASQRYNYNTLSWEDDGQGVYTPAIPIPERVRDWVIDRFRKLDTQQFFCRLLLK